MKKCSICGKSKDENYCYDCLSFMISTMYSTYPEQFQKLVKYSRKVLGGKK